MIKKEPQAWLNFSIALFSRLEAQMTSTMEECEVDLLDSSFHLHHEKCCLNQRGLHLVKLYHSTLVDG